MAKCPQKQKTIQQKSQHQYINTVNYPLSPTHSPTLPLEHSILCLVLFITAHSRLEYQAMKETLNFLFIGILGRMHTTGSSYISLFVYFPWWKFGSHLERVIEIYSLFFVLWRFFSYVRQVTIVSSVTYMA